MGVFLESSLISEEPMKISLVDQVLDLVLEVIAFLDVVTVVLMKMTVPSFVTASDLCPDQVRSPEESLVMDLEKNLGPKSHQEHLDCQSRMSVRHPPDLYCESAGKLDKWLVASLVRPSSETTVGLGQELAMKLSSNSLAKWSKDEMEDGFNRLYHIRADPWRVVEKV
ncbi:hypothetical protein B296_00050452 [Ensete ventricosum]|uniref:Uncharacterized protein n=1 Tax=Ensete ventricosum TaxID=4639 RepID=A0A426YDB3_ENSVE|nr:hypothetical protein B296_00050452 [Ensete ventricosum]